RGHSFRPGHAALQDSGWFVAHHQVAGHPPGRQDQRHRTRAGAPGDRRTQGPSGLRAVPARHGIPGLHQHPRSGTGRRQSIFGRRSQMTAGPASHRPRLPRLAITSGDPAGIGPELVARLAASPLAADLVAISDAGLLERAAQRCGVTLKLEADDGQPRNLRAAGSLRIVDVPLRAEEIPGQLDPRNAFHVLNMLAQAADGCFSGAFDGVVTAPVQKSVINDAGEPFTGHTELFAQRAGCEVVMMLASPELRVALATTHLHSPRYPERS